MFQDYLFGCGGRTRFTRAPQKMIRLCQLSKMNWKTAAQNGNIERLIELRLSELNTIDTTALEQACKNGHKECVVFLVQECNLEITKRSLQFCIKYKQDDILEWLKTTYKEEQKKLKKEKITEKVYKIIEKEEKEDTYEMMFGKAAFHS